MKNKSVYVLLAIGLCFIVNSSYARIKLITLPVREKVMIQLENPQTTIIEEERIVPLKKGFNDIDFSWHNTSIRADTIVFRFLDNKDGLKTNVLSVSYPPNESALTWKVSANKNGSARAKITYAINRLDKNYQYIARSNNDETEMNLSQSIKVINSTGEEYLDAFLDTGKENSLNLPLGLNETQEFINHQFKSIPIEKSYTVNAAELGYRNRAQDKLNVLMHYHIFNDAQHSLGKYPLAPGKVRIYQKDKNGTLVFVGEDWAKYTGRQGEAKLYIGQARDIVVKRIIEQKKRQRINGNLYNIDVVVKYEIENFKDKSLNLIIEESLPHLRNEVYSAYRSAPHNQTIEWRVNSKTNFNHKPLKKLTNSQKIAYEVTLPARLRDENVSKLEKKLNITFKNEW